MQLNKSQFIRLLLFILLSVPVKPMLAQEENWTHFRGSALNGIAVTEAPLLFNDSLNIKWKTEIPGRGWSSPVVFGEQIWITTASEDGKELFALCLDYESGATVHTIKLFSPDSVMRRHSFNSYATPTPCIEKGFVYTHFGSLGTACINTADGSVVWKRSDFHCDHQQGPASSPVIYRDLLILHYDGNDVRFLVALKKSTGEIAWKKERPREIYPQIPESSRKAYITPLLINVGGRDMLVSNGSGICSGYDPLTGEEIWRVVRGSGGTISMPFSEEGIVYFYTGSQTKESGKTFAEILAINPDGNGDITESGILWKKETESLQLLTPVIRNGLIYTVDPRNHMICMDAKTSETVWEIKQKDKYNSSPVYASGKIYFGSKGGEMTVISEGRELNILARNQLEGEIWATPAILRNSIILRTSTHLYRISK